MADMSEDELANTPIGTRTWATVALPGQPLRRILVEVTGHEDGGTQLKQVKE